MFTKRTISNFKQPKIYNPPQEPQRTGNGKLAKIITLLLLIIVILGGLIYLFFYSSVFKIKNIILENAQNQSVSRYLEKYQGKNIILLNASQVKTDIYTNFPELENLKIIRGLPDTLKVQLEERLSRIVWQTQDKNYLVDGLGRIYQETEELTELPKVKDNKNIAVEINQVVASQNFIDFISQLYSQFSQSCGFNITRFEVNETIFQVNALTDQGWQVIFDVTRKADSQLADLNLFLAGHKNEIEKYIDLRVEGRVYFQ